MRVFKLKKKIIKLIYTMLDEKKFQARIRRDWKKNTSMGDVARTNESSMSIYAPA